MKRLLVSLFILAFASPAAAARNGSTRLLFPYATNASGFDTGIAIANTSMDPLGTKTETGSCTLTFFGTGAPLSPISTGTIAAGALFTSVVSVLAPGFTGYIIADCDFSHAHAIAFGSDLGARNFAYGDEALVLPAKRKASGERLNQ